MHNPDVRVVNFFLVMMMSVSVHVGNENGCIDLYLHILVRVTESLEKRNYFCLPILWTVSEEVYISYYTFWQRINIVTHVHCFHLPTAGGINLLLAFQSAEWNNSWKESGVEQKTFIEKPRDLKDPIIL